MGQRIRQAGERAAFCWGEGVSEEALPTCPLCKDAPVSSGGKNNPRISCATPLCLFSKYHFYLVEWSRFPRYTAADLQAAREEGAKKAIEWMIRCINTECLDPSDTPRILEQFKKAWPKFMSVVAESKKEKL